jgi:leader peptidase (prepilin peptidase)/N-methyltransferase
MPLFLSPGEFLRPPVWEWFALAVGLIVGSFANVCIHRLAQDPPQSVVSPPSRCPKCGRQIRPWENVPVVSYLLLAGRCRGCRNPISLRYPAVEAANGFAYLALAAAFGPAPQTAVSMALVTGLLILGLIDLDVQILPDAITLPGLALGLAASFLPGSRLTPLESAAAAAGAYLVFAAFAAAARAYYGEEALGRGDWKLVAMLGAFLGWQGVLLTIFLGSLAGAVVGLTLIALGRARGRTKVPFGSFLALAGIAAVFTGEPLLAWYRGLLRG